MKPQVVSTRWTMLFKLLLPTFWIIFFGGLAIASLLVELKVNEPFTPLSARIMLFTFLFSSVAILYLMFMRLKWVALDETHIYVSNFFKVYRYTYDSIAAIESSKTLWWTKINVEFHNKGYFGQNIHFIASPYWGYFLEKNPHVMEQIAASTASAQLEEQEQQAAEHKL